MAKMEWNITPQMIAEVVNSVDDSRFDTHKVEQRVLRRYTLEFARDLLALGHTTDVLNQFSMHFSKRIGAEFPGQIRKTHKEQSLNLAGEMCSNQQWEKIHPQTPITEI
jgi:DNA polymerase II large subunit